MADLSKTIQIIFSGVDELSGPINTITSKLDGFSANVESIAAPLAGAADNILKMDAALVAMAAGGLLYAFDKSKDFESAVIELEKVLGDGMGAQAAIDEAITLSETYGQSAESILLSIADFKQAGFDLEDSLTLTKDALDLVIAGNIDAAQSSDLIIAALKGFGAGADEARTYIDILNEVSNNYATDVEQLAIGLAKISPIADQMGFSMAEAAGLLTPVIEIFRSGDEAANALKTGLLKLVDDANPVADALASIGVSQYDANGILRSGKDIYLDVAAAFQNLDENQKLFITSQIVGIEQSAKMVGVFDNLGLATEIASTAMNSAGSAAKEVAARLESAQASVDIFKTSFVNLAVAIGDNFRLAVVEAVDGGAEIEQALRDIIEADTFQPIFDEINSFASKIGDLLSTVASNLPEAFEKVDFSGLLDALGNIGDSISDMFDGVDLSTPEGLAEVIQDVVDTLASLGNVTAGMIDQFAPFAQSIWGMVESFNDLDVASQESAGEILALAKEVVAAGPKIAAVIILIGDYADKLTPIFRYILTEVSSFFNETIMVWNGIKFAFLDILQFLLEKSLLLTKIPGFGFLEDDVKANIDVIQQWKDSAEKNMIDAASASVKNLTGISDAFGETGTAANESEKKVDEYGNTLFEIPDRKKTDVEADADEQSIKDTKDAIEDAAPGSLTTKAGAEPDKPSLEDTKSEIEKNIPFQKTTKGGATPDATSLKNTKSAIDDAIPESKMMEIQLQGDIDKEIESIKAAASSAQAAFEYQAKVDIAQLEADAKVAAAAFDSVADSVSATAAAAADMAGALAGSGIHFYEIYELVLAQMDMEQQALNMQRDLVAAQVEYMEAKTEALRGDDALIKIDSNGLEPALEMIMWQILQKVQVRATEEASEFLLGLGVGI